LFVYWKEEKYRENERLRLHEWGTYGDEIFVKKINKSVFPHFHSILALKKLERTTRHHFFT
jgi:hypothetical protein